MKAPAMLLVAALALAGASAASAQSRCVAPPGSSAVDQYCEVVPDGSGGRGLGRHGSAPLPKKTATRLQRAGTDGEAVLSLAEETGAFDAAESAGKSSRGGKRTGKGGPTAGDRSSSPAGDQSLPDADAGTSSNNLFEATAASTGDATRVGSGFIWVVLGVVVAIGAWGWVAYRRRQE